VCVCVQYSYFVSCLFGRVLAGTDPFDRFEVASHVFGCVLNTLDVAGKE